MNRLVCVCVCDVSWLILVYDEYMFWFSGYFLIPYFKCWDVCNITSMCMHPLEIQWYTFWVYQYITSFVSWYSDILHDSYSIYSWFLQMDWAFFQNHHVLYLPNSYKTVKLAYNHSISHKIAHIICSVEVKTWIYHARHLIYPDIQYIDTT